MSEQLDIFGELDEPAPVPPFKVFADVHESKCGWCGRKNMQGGGAYRHPEDSNLSLFYEYCLTCYRRWGYPKVRDLAGIVVVKPQNA